MHVPRRKALAVSLIAFGAVSVLSSPLLPLYDGVGFPDEAYRYIQQSAGAKPTRQPTGGSMSSSVKDGANTDILEVVTPENGPQALVVLLPGTVQLKPAAAEIVQIDVQPVKPTILPADGKLAGNVYVLSAKPSAVKGDATPTVELNTGNPDDNSHLISLRLPQGNAANPTLEYRAPGSQSWQKGVTEKVGADIYRTPIRGFGEYALVEQKQPPVAAPAKTGTRLPIFLIAAAAFLVAVVTVIVGIRRSRKQVSDHGKSGKTPR